MRIRLTAVLGAFLFTVLFPIAALAQQPTSNASKEGLYVAPGLLKINVPIESIEQTSTLTLKNNYKTAQKFSLELRPTDPYKNTIDLKADVPGTIKDNVLIDRSQVDLLPEQSVNIKLTIKNSESLPPGASYFGIVIRNVSSVEQTQRVSVQSAINVQVILIKEKGAVRKLDLVNSSVPRFSIGTPKEARMTLKNTGNIPTVMHGNITVQKNKQLYLTGTINEKSETVLPGQSVSYASKFIQSRQIIWPGIYSVQGQIRADQQNIATYEFKTNGMLILPIWFVLALFFVFAYFARRQYRKWRARRPVGHLDKVHTMRRTQRKKSINRSGGDT